MTVGRAQLSSEVDVAAELEHAVVSPSEKGVALRLGEREAIKVFGFVGFERSTVLILHQRHAEHVEMITLFSPLRVEDESTGNVVVNLLGACHGLLHSDLS